MLFASLIVDAFAALGCMVFMLGAALVAAVAAFLHTDVGKSLLGVKRPQKDATKPAEG